MEVCEQAQCSVMIVEINSLERNTEGIEELY